MGRSYPLSFILCVQPDNWSCTVKPSSTKTLPDWHPFHKCPNSPSACRCRCCLVSLLRHHHRGTIHLQAPTVNMTLITPQYLCKNTCGGSDEIGSCLTELWFFFTALFSIYDQRLRLYAAVNKTSPPVIKERNHLPSVDSGGTVVLVSQDGIQRPPLRFPRGGHLLQFLSCLENGLLPHGQLDPPLWSQRGKVRTEGPFFAKTQICITGILLDHPINKSIRKTFRFGNRCQRLVVFISWSDTDESAAWRSLCTTAQELPPLMNG